MGILSRPAPVWAKELLCKMQQLENQLEEGLEQLMSLVTVDDAALAQLDTDLKGVAQSLADKVAKLEADLAAAGTPPPPGSLDAIKADVTTLQGIGVPVTPPVTPPPVTPPVTPPAV